MDSVSVAAKLGAMSAAMLLGSVVWAHSEDAHEEEIDYSGVEEHVFGKASDPRKAQRTIELEMSDMMRFTPAEITIDRGDKVRFVIRNNGQLMHEMVLGTLDELREHAELMKKFPGMEHDEPHMAHVPPGNEQEMGWEFTNAGEFFYGCLVPGHFDAGMMGRIVVR